MDSPLETARHEVKFVTYDSRTAGLMSWIRLHWVGFRSHYPDRVINNIYFDTPDCDALEGNLSGVSKREKLRYRWYGEEDFPGAGRLELKCRQNLLGWKLACDVPEAPYHSGDRWHDVRNSIIEQTGSRGKHWLDANPTVVLINRYKRKYFVSMDGQFRLTVDTSMKVWDQHFKSFPNFVTESPTAKTIVVELKCDRKYGKELPNVIDGIPARVGRHSKYVAGIKASQNYLAEWRI